MLTHDLFAVANLVCFAVHHNIVKSA